MSLPEPIRERLVAAGPVADLRPVGGGDICAAFRLRWRGRSCFLKHTPAGGLQEEARGLGLLRDRGALPVPEVLDVGPTHLVLAWVEPGATRSATGRHLGEGMAELHRAGGGTYGLDHDNRIGPLAQDNAADEDWVRFYGERRLLARARDAGLRGADRRRLEALVARLDRWLPRSPPASLLHGDLWSGNVLVDEAGQPWLIDPAVHRGDREVDLAMAALFGGFPAGFWEAYEAAWPLEPGAVERRPLYQLHPLLVHVALFGGGWLGSVRSILSRYA